MKYLKSINPILNYKNIFNRLKYANTAGYFYDDNKILNYGESKFYCKDYNEITKKTKTYIITAKEAMLKIKNSLK